VPGAILARADRKQIPATARAAYRLVRDVYRVELEVSEPITKPRKLTLEVLDAQGHRLRDVQLLYPRYLAPQPEGKERLK